MTDSDFEDTSNFDNADISGILRDIDNANLALDIMDGRAERLKANIMSLLQAQSQPNPYSNIIEPEPLQSSISGSGSPMFSVNEQDTLRTLHNPIATLTPSDASSHSPDEST
ncbi:hypothetical protein BGZ65_006805 [Modicella reniformis]|uniref:Uncharacterized protein n=1 Tax=Modicella reniformis TaxID=1440133 RepID=A0A9P6MC19_9FUNG|nr:hypothetical protein BGZ65_006805 [Modicella reniformis]